jgi:hypothetical protein
MTQEKLEQLASNQQYLFENISRVKYSAGGITREGGSKMIAGKSAFPALPTRSYLYLTINFGSYFTAGSRPVVLATLEAKGGSMHRAKVVIQGHLGTGEVNHAGFIAIVTGDTYKSLESGWIHWWAIGY